MLPTTYSRARRFIDVTYQYLADEEIKMGSDRLRGIDELDDRKEENKKG
jgi:hypothetical protein